MLAYYESHGRNAGEAGRVFDYDRRLVLEWVKKKDQIVNEENKRGKFVVHSKQIEGWFPTIEKALVEWITTMRAENKAVDGSLIKHKALSIYPSCPESEKEGKG